jgi:hypothetical protein
VGWGKKVVGGLQVLSCYEMEKHEAVNGNAAMAENCSQRRNAKNLVGHIQVTAAMGRLLQVDYAQLHGPIPEAEDAN